MTQLQYTITKKDFEEFLKDKGFNKACPSCGNKRYGIVPNENAPVYFSYHLQTKDGFDFREGYPIMTVICDNCGYMWHFSMEVVQLWYNEKMSDEQRKH